MALAAGSDAPPFDLLAAWNGTISRVTLDNLLVGNAGLILHTYPLDFTGG